MKSIKVLIFAIAVCEVCFGFEAEGLVKLASRGHAQSQFQLAVLYKMGLIMPKNPVESAKWMLAAAEQDHTEAQYQLANAYFTGFGLNNDFAKAFSWFLRAAIKDHDGAKVALACMKFTGLGVKRSEGEAVNFLLKISDPDNISKLVSGNIKCSEKLSFNDRLKLVENCANSGSGAACFALYSCYSHPEIYKSELNDSQIGFKWLKKAAELKFKDSYYLMGSSYELGIGVPQNKSMAHVWYNVGAAVGCRECVDSRMRLAAKMTPEQLAEAEKEAKLIFDKIK